MADDARRRMADALTLLEKRLVEWQKEGVELQAQLLHVTTAVFLDNRPPSVEEEAWAAALLESKTKKEEFSDLLDRTFDRLEGR